MMLMVTRVACEQREVIMAGGDNEVRRITFTIQGGPDTFLDTLREFVAWAENDHMNWLYFSNFDWKDVAKFELLPKPEGGC